MSSANPWLILADLVALALLAGVLFRRRHRRADMVTLLVGINIGVMAVAVALGSAEIGAGLGLGLFGALAIIRLRSDELGLHEIAYAFSALAIGLLAGFEMEPLWLGPALMAGVVAGMALSDWPGLLQEERRLRLTLDRAITDEGELVTEVEALLGRTIDEVVVKEIDLVRDLTSVDARYRLTPDEAAERRSGAAGRRVGRRSAVRRSDLVEHTDPTAR
ncbi:MAG: DUF4956 domain-containing protein [Ilumatobacter sp.]